MQVLGLGVSLFLSSLLFHLLLWRIYLPKRQTRAILMVSLLFLGVFWICWIFKSFSGWVQVLHISLLHVSLTLAYIVGYTAIEAESPSGLMVLYLYQAGKNGLSRDSLNKVITHDLFIGNRISGLVQNGQLKEVNSQYHITPAGHKLMYVFRLPHQLMKRNANVG